MVLLEERIDLCFLAFAENAFSTHVELAHSDRGQSVHAVEVFLGALISVVGTSVI